MRCVSEGWRLGGRRKEEKKWRRTMRKEHFEVWRKKEEEEDEGQKEAASLKNNCTVGSTLTALCRLFQRCLAVSPV